MTRARRIQHQDYSEFEQKNALFIEPKNITMAPQTKKAAAKKKANNTEKHQPTTTKKTMDYVTSWWSGGSSQQPAAQQQNANAGGVSEKILLHATIEQAMKVITDYAHYGDFLEGCNRTEIVHQSPDGKVADVFWDVSVSIKTVEYTLRLTENGDGRGITWTVVDGKTGPFVKNVGGWSLKETETPGIIEATYFVDIELNVWVPEFLKNWVLSSGLPATLSSFKKRIEQEAAKK